MMENENSPKPWRRHGAYLGFGENTTTCGPPTRAESQFFVVKNFWMDFIFHSFSWCPGSRGCAGPRVRAAGPAGR